MEENAKRIATETRQSKRPTGKLKTSIMERDREEERDGGRRTGGRQREHQANEKASRTKATKKERQKSVIKRESWKDHMQASKQEGKMPCN